MKKEIIKVFRSCDYHECEVCGDSYENSTVVHYGEWTYGKPASAHCYDSVYTEYDEAFDALIEYLSLPKPNYTEEIPYFTETEYISFFRKMGYFVKVYDF